MAPYKFVRSRFVHRGLRSCPLPSLRELGRPYYFQKQKCEQRGDRIVRTQKYDQKVL